MTPHTLVKDHWTALAIVIAILSGASATLGSWAPLILAAGMGICVIGVYRPMVLLGVTFIAILLDSQGLMNVLILGLPLTASKAATAAMILLYLVHCVVLKKPPLAWTPVTAGLLAVIATMIASVSMSMEPWRAWQYVAGVVMLTMLIHVLYQAIEPEDLPGLFRFMAMATVVLLLMTLFGQEETGNTTRIDYAWMQRTSGAYLDPNMWATNCIVLVPILLGSLIQDKHWSSRILLPTLAVLYPAIIIQSLSRAGIVALLLTVPFLLYMFRAHKKALLLGVVAAVCLIPMVLNMDAAILRYQTLLDPALEANLGHGSLTERKGLLIAGIEIFRSHPILGVGVGMFQVHASYVSAGWVWKVAHNSYLNIAAEQGLVGLLSHAYFFWLVGRNCWNATFSSQSTPYQRSVGIGYATSIIGFAAMAMTLNLASFNMAYFVLALGMVIHKQPRQKSVMATKPFRLEEAA